MKKLNSIPMFGDHSKDVTELQTALLYAGFNPGKIDGIFGNDTQNALKKLQLANGLDGSGIVGHKTIALLDFELAIIKKPDGFVALSWEYHFPDRINWSNFIFKTIENLLDTHFLFCEDIINFRPDYNSLTRQQKINIWAELVSAICKFESGWKTTSWMPETNFSNKDSVTKLPVKSEGLMQLSYQDKDSYKNLPCKFDWQKDKQLDVNDSNKTIFDPYINLEFGINILAYQIKTYKHIAMSKNVYWAILKIDGKYTRITEIIKMVKLIKC